MPFSHLCFRIYRVKRCSQCSGRIFSAYHYRLVKSVRSLGDNSKHQSNSSASITTTDRFLYSVNNYWCLYLLFSMASRISASRCMRWCSRYPDILGGSLTYEVYDRPGILRIIILYFCPPKRVHPPPPKDILCSSPTRRSQFFVTSTPESAQQI